MKEGELLIEIFVAFPLMHCAVISITPAGTSNVNCVTGSIIFTLMQSRRYEVKQKKQQQQNQSIHYKMAS